MHRSPDRLIVAAGGVIYRQGEPAAAAFLLIRGSVELRVAHGGVSRRGAGAVFGEGALVDDAPRESTAVALEDCELIAVDEAALAARLGDVDPLLRLCLGAIVARASHAAAPAAPGAPPRVKAAWTAQADDARAVLTFEHQLRIGIARGELDLHFQPIVELATGRLAGFEALVRWQHPDRGLLLPRDFIPFAEAAGVISDITALCLRHVGAQLPAILDLAKGNPAVGRPFVSVNVSGIDLAQPAFAAQAVSILCDAGVDPEDVKLEVTESILMQDADRCARTLQNCRDQGLAIAIDDFGTGYSSLHYLNSLPISVLKMDQSFCRSLLADASGRKIIGAILHLGRELGLSVIAEGVESVAQRDLLQTMGCAFGQGYLFGAPLGLRDTLALIRGWRLRPGPSAAIAVSPAA